ncbi:MAG: choice-of-anchor Q domain-containing protein [Planctomycetota bacterium]
MISVIAAGELNRCSSVRLGCLPEGDQIGSSGSPLDPQLAALADNGGPTQTHAPRVGSPVINAGDNDQAVTGAGRRTQLEYDDHGRLTKRIGIRSRFTAGVKRMFWSLSVERPRAHASACNRKPLINANQR